MTTPVDYLAFFHEPSAPTGSTATAEAKSPTADVEKIVDDLTRELMANPGYTPQPPDVLPQNYSLVALKSFRFIVGSWFPVATLRVIQSPGYAHITITCSSHDAAMLTRLRDSLALQSHVNFITDGRNNQIVPARSPRQVTSEVFRELTRLYPLVEVIQTNRNSAHGRADVIVLCNSDRMVADVNLRTELLTRAITGENFSPEQLNTVQLSIRATRGVSKYLANTSPRPGAKLYYQYEEPRDVPVPARDPPPISITTLKVPPRNTVESLPSPAKREGRQLVTMATLSAYVEAPGRVGVVSNHYGVSAGHSLWGQPDIIEFDTPQGGRDRILGESLLGAMWPAVLSESMVRNAYYGDFDPNVLIQFDSPQDTIPTLTRMISDVAVIAKLNDNVFGWQEGKCVERTVQFGDGKCVAVPEHDEYLGRVVHFGRDAEVVFELNVVGIASRAFLINLKLYIELSYVAVQTGGRESVRGDSGAMLYKNEAGARPVHHSTLTRTVLQPDVPEEPQLELLTPAHFALAQSQALLPEKIRKRPKYVWSK